MSTRRTFIKQSSLAPFVVDPVTNELLNYFHESGVLDSSNYDFACSVIRPEDLLQFHFYFYNFEFQDRWILRDRLRGSTKTSKIIVRIPQQHIAEQVLDLSAGLNSKLKNNNRIKSFISGYSFLVFKPKQEKKENNDTKFDLKLNVESLLDFSQYQLVLPHSEVPDIKTFLNQVNISNLDKIATRIEYPYKLLISPFVTKDKKGEPSSFLTFSKPRNKLTTLYDRILESEHLKIHALWQNDLLLIKSNGQFLYNEIEFKAYDQIPYDKLDGAYQEHGIIPRHAHRELIVNSTKLADGLLIQAKQFTFSSLGITAELSCAGDFNDEEGRKSNLTNWKQVTALGRDNLAMITYLVVDTEFGMQFKATEINERVFKSGVSYLQKRFYLEKYEDELDFSYTNYNGREFKLMKPNFEGKIYFTPIILDSLIKNELKHKIPEREDKTQRVPFTALKEPKLVSTAMNYSATELYKFPFIAIDHDDNEIDLEVSLVFIPKTDKEKFRKNLLRANNFKKALNEFYRINHARRKIAFTEAYEDKLLDKDGKVVLINEKPQIENIKNGVFTTHYTLSFANINPSYSEDRPLISRLYYARVEVEAIKNLAPNAINNISFVDEYYDYDQEKNPLEIFAAFLSEEINIENFTLDKEWDLIAKNKKSIRGLYDKGVGTYTHIIKADTIISHISRLPIGTSVNPELNEATTKKLAIIKTKLRFGEFNLNKEIREVGHDSKDVLNGLNPNIIGNIRLLDILALLELKEFPLFKMVESAQNILASFNETIEILKEIFEALKDMELLNFESVRKTFTDLEGKVDDIKDEFGEIKEEFREIRNEYAIFQESFRGIDSDKRNKFSAETEGITNSIFKDNDSQFRSHYKSKYSRNLDSTEFETADLINTIGKNDRDEFDLLLGEIFLRNFIESISKKIKDEPDIIIKGTIYNELVKSIELTQKYFSGLDQAFEATKVLWSNKTEYADALRLTTEVYAEIKKVFLHTIIETGYIEDSELIAYVKFNASIELIFKEISELENISSDTKTLFGDIYKDAKINGQPEVFPIEVFKTRTRFDAHFSKFKKEYNELILQKLGGENAKNDYQNKIASNPTNKQDTIKDIGNFFSEFAKNIENWLKKLKSDIASNKNVQQAKRFYKKLKDAQELVKKITNPKIESSWRTTSIKSASFSFVEFHAHNKGTTYFAFRANLSAVIKFDGLKRPPRFTDLQLSTSNEIGNFGITFCKSIRIDFERIAITAGTNQKEDVDLKILDVHFTGVLKFVSALQKYFESLTKVLDFDVDARGIRMSYLLPIPDINGGVIQFSNLKFNIGLSIPFRANTPIQILLGINSKTVPFKIYAYGFPGIGYFVMIIEPKRGIVGLEILIEFGKTASFNFGIAEGELSFRAGLYFRKYYNDVIFKGYVIAHGRISILKVFNFSIYFHLILKYENGLLDGEAILIFKKKIGFLKLKFRVRVYMEFKAPKEEVQGNKELQTNKLALSGDENATDLNKLRVLNEALREKQKIEASKVFNDDPESFSDLEAIDDNELSLTEKEYKNHQRTIRSTIEKAEKQNPELILDSKKDSKPKPIQNYSYEDYYKSYFLNS